MSEGLLTEDSQEPPLIHYFFWIAQNTLLINPLGLTTKANLILPKKTTGNQIKN
jgi:hypothetical protein